MNKLLPILFLILIISCKNDKVDPDVPTGALQKITVNGKMYASFDYSNGILVKESYFGSCETPYHVTTYDYESGRVKSVRSGLRGVYSSNSNAMCDPNGVFEVSNTTFEYDSQNRIFRALRPNSITQYIYGDKQVIEKLSYNAGASVRDEYYKYDDRGNIIEVRRTDPANAGTTKYEYDDKVNPLHRAGTFTGGPLSPFNTPNNVVKAFDPAGKLLWERKFSYTPAGLPSECAETNGAVQQYHYK